jgi:hypothetical protein
MQQLRGSCYTYHAACTIQLRSWSGYHIAMYIQYCYTATATNVTAVIQELSCNYYYGQLSCIIYHAGATMKQLSCSCYHATAGYVEIPNLFNFQASSPSTHIKKARRGNSNKNQLSGGTLQYSSSSGFPLHPLQHRSSSGFPLLPLQYSSSSGVPLHPLVAAAQGFLFTL